MERQLLPARLTGRDPVGPSNDPREFTRDAARITAQDRRASHWRVRPVHAQFLSRVHRDTCGDVRTKFSSGVLHGEAQFIFEGMQHVDALYEDARRSPAETRAFSRARQCKRSVRTKISC